MTRGQALSAVGLAARCVVATLFAYAAVLKLDDLPTFAVSIHNYRIVPEFAVPWIALFVPSCEISAAVALLVPAARRGGAVVALALLAVFTVAIAQAMFRHINIDCGCFGSETPVPVSWKTLVRNGSLMLLCAVSLVASRKHPVAATAAAPTPHVDA